MLTDIEIKSLRKSAAMELEEAKVDLLRDDWDLKEVKYHLIKAVTHIELLYWNGDRPKDAEPYFITSPKAE
jgi:hypothetical protein